MNKLEEYIHDLIDQDILNDDKNSIDDLSSEQIKEITGIYLKENEGGEGDEAIIENAEFDDFRELLGDFMMNDSAKTKEEMVNTLQKGVCGYLEDIIEANIRDALWSRREANGAAFV